ncbi:MAG: zinc-binding alcohol dehydrogenase family protein [Chloroflexi bacterium]|jgi:zinc-binding alcohol dehydrogenase family protein|nr:zinc-binding alcohol dehydrogenase family protein [Chloroflexota bacterium]
MKAVAYRQSLPITEADSLFDVELPDPPQPAGRDLLVQVKAISVNPVDTKIRVRTAPPAGEVKVLGWDAAGIVVKTGPEVQFFRPGDEVWYSGSIDRSGSNAELQLMDERIVGKKPASLSFAEAAALPLTTLTAWELLFERLGVPRGQTAAGQSLLIVGAAGGVGSILTQLACQLTEVNVIGSASRPETVAWVRSLGVEHVIDHRQPLSAELARIGIPQVEYVAGLTHTGEHYPEIVESLAPQGHFGLIDDPGPIDVSLLKRKSISLHWEYMFTRAFFKTADMIEQHQILEEVARLVDTGVIRTTLGEHFGRINAANLKRAHALIESGTAKGKIVLEGF